MGHLRVFAVFRLAAASTKGERAMDAYDRRFRASARETAVGDAIKYDGQIFNELSRAL